jgi:hypothetical protein
MNPVESPCPASRELPDLIAWGRASTLYFKNVILATILLLTAASCFGQTDSLKTTPSDSSQKTSNVSPPDSLREFITDPNYFLLTPKQKRTRAWVVGGGLVAAYAATTVALYSTWYKDYPQSNFHVFNDFPEWQQMDKVGHLYSAYIESRTTMELWRWAGVGRSKRILIAGLSGIAYQTIIEVLDGFSSDWGWSWGDIGANILGSGLLVAQELAWDDQRIKLKFSFHPKDYNDIGLRHRRDQLFGTKTMEKMLKDYNGQTYWASANIHSFFPKSNIPPWLGISVGYGAEGMFGGRKNIATDESGNIVFDRTDLKRYRQWYLAPDIDMSKIKTKSKTLKAVFFVLSVFKFPLPGLEFSNGKVKALAIAF